MVTARQIRSLASQITGRFPARRIILFGSYAYGRPTADSDVDVLVVLPCDESKAVDKAVEIRQAIDVPFALDLLVHSLRTIRQRLAWNNFFLKEIMEKGKVIYDAAGGRMGGKSRS